MDMPRLHRSSGRSPGLENSSAPLQFAPNILDTFIPGYALISKFMLEISGVDIGIFVSAGVFLVTFGTTVKFLYSRIGSSIASYAMASVYFDEHDDLFHNVLDWVAEQYVGKSARRLKAVSKAKKPGRETEEDHLEDKELNEGELFHFGKWVAKTPPRYEPFFGSYYFLYNGCIFVFERGRRERTGRSAWERTSEEEHITLKTPGWSTAPIKSLLKHIKGWSVEREKCFTVVRCPQSKEVRRYQGSWVRVTSRPSRPMETVVLDPEQKEKIIVDVNEYLLPSSRRWYATRGIPYRRGYLLHGEPGTGKSSLSFALAGLFGLDIYLISLLDPALTESDLGHLFNNLPRRCIVLLEDIDTAGLSRDEKSDEPKTKDSDEESGKETEKIETTKPYKGSQRMGRRADFGANSDEPKSGISLSGLLNAIDGVASHEGRVLIMTTNFPEKLDSALIRPGRVDMQVAFTLATTHQIRAIFTRMYCSELKSNTTKRDGINEPSKIITYQNHKRHDSHQNGDLNLSNGKIEVEKVKYAEKKGKNELKDLSHDELKNLAEEFSDEIPEKKFSPAEIQNFLILRKKDPWKAINDVKTWRDDMMEAKERNLKVVPTH